MTSHDQLWKDLSRAFFPDLLFLVDPDFAAHLVVGHFAVDFTFLDKEVFLDQPEGKRHEADLVAEVPDRPGNPKLLIHVEIERRYSTNMGLRIWRYSHQLRERHGRPVVSIVVFLRGGPPGAHWVDRTEQALGQEIYRFRYLSFGVSKLPAEDLLARSEPLAWALASLAHPGKIGRARLKLLLLRKIASAQASEAERFSLTNCVETYLQLAGSAAEEYTALRLAEENPEVEAMETTWAERMEAQYEQRGLKKGLEQGLERGLGKGAERLRSTLLRQLGQRFGDVSPAVRARIAAIDSLDELGDLTDRILEVRSIDELGLGR